MLPHTHFSSFSWSLLSLDDTFLLSSSLGDLAHIHSSPFFFANKFYLNEDQIAYTCLEQRLFNQTRDLHLGRLQVNTTLYEESLIVRHRLITSDKSYITHPIGEGDIIELLKNRSPYRRGQILEYKRQVEEIERRKKQNRKTTGKERTTKEPNYTRSQIFTWR